LTPGRTTQGVAFEFGVRVAASYVCNLRRKSEAVNVAIGRVTGIKPHSLRARDVKTCHAQRQPPQLDRTPFITAVQTAKMLVVS